MGGAMDKTMNKPRNSRDWRSYDLPRWQQRKWPGWFRLTVILTASLLLWAVIIAAFLI